VRELSHNNDTQHDFHDTAPRFRYIPFPPPQASIPQVTLHLLLPQRPTRPARQAVAQALAHLKRDLALAGAHLRPKQGIHLLERLEPRLGEEEVCERGRAVKVSLVLTGQSSMNVCRGEYLQTVKKPSTAKAAKKK